MVFNATFKNISVISWRSVLLVEENGVPGENHWPAASHGQTLSHNVNLFNLNIFYCLNNDKRIRHKFFNLVLSSPYTYNIQYTIW
jgi:hypothetical protein